MTAPPTAGCSSYPLGIAASALKVGQDWALVWSGSQVAHAEQRLLMSPVYMYRQTKDNLHPKKKEWDSTE